MKSEPPAPKLYHELASWWHILSAPEDYAEEAELFRRVITESSPEPPKTLLELGSGGGNNASHLKKHFRMTLVDISKGMLAQSRHLNPECEHIRGDMRSVRLGRTFDSVFVHDAVMYMTCESDLRRAMETAYIHCRPGGVALFTPDDVRETFKERTKRGGHDGDGRALRYLEWTYDPDPEDTTFVLEMVYMLRDGDNPVRVVHDRHVLGLFALSDWLRLLRDVGFEPRTIADSYECDLFSGIRRE